MDKKIYRLLITIAASGGAGVCATAVVASGENGYTAGFIILPILILEFLACTILFVIAIILIVKENLAGFYFLLAALLIPAATVGSAMVAKRCEIGAYKVDPIEPMIPPIANKIIFNSDVSDDEVQEFWREVLSYPHESGRGEMSLPGIQSIGSSSPENGHQVLVYSYFSQASEEQKSFVRNRIESSPKVFQLLENVDTTPKDTRPIPEIDASNGNANVKKPMKTVILN